MRKRSVVSLDDARVDIAKPRSIVRLARQLLMLRRTCMCLALLFFASHARASPALDGTYDRIARDLLLGKPLTIQVYVALCDNDSQGIVPVKNREICNGDVPRENLYWATKGGLARYLREAGYRHGYERTHVSQDVLIEAQWTRTVTPGGALRARGVVSRFAVNVVARAYRGSAISRAMADYLHSVHSSGEAHVVGYIGHNYMLDVAKPHEMIPDMRQAIAAKAVFALSCLGEQRIRPALTRDEVHILLLNRDLTYPGAWSVGGIVEALAAGLDARGIHRVAATHFAIGKGKPPASMGRAFTFSE